MDDPARILPLTPVDHVFTGPNAYPITFLFLFDHPLDRIRLRDSLDAALADFWPLRSELIHIAPHSYGLEPSADGLAFEVASSTEIYTETADSDRYITPVQSVPGQPLTRIKLTDTPTGSILGVSISHALADGFSYFHFLSSWARMAQGKKIIHPSHGRETLIPNLMEPAVEFESGELLSRCGLFWIGRRGGNQSAIVEMKGPSLSKDTLQAMRAATQGDCEIPLYDNDVITASIWQTYGAQWSGIGEGATAYVGVPFDFRSLLREIPRTYFGCALAFVTADMDVAKLRQAPLGEIACRVRRCIGRVDAAYVWDSLHTLESLRRARGLEAMGEIEVRHPQRGIAVTNLTRMPIDSLDFGSGPPVGYRVLAQADRGAAILPAEDGVEIRIFPPMRGESTGEATVSK